MFALSIIDALVGKKNTLIISKLTVNNEILSIMNQQIISQDHISKIDILIWRVIKLFIKNKKHILENLNLTCSQFEILSAIHYLQSVKTDIIQAELSEKAAIDPMTTSTILRNLEKKGLITRQRSTVNTRTVIVNLTKGGIELLEKANHQMKLYTELIYKDINEKHLISQLTKLSNKLYKLNY